MRPPDCPIHGTMPIQLGAIFRHIAAVVILSILLSGAALGQQASLVAFEAGPVEASPFVSVPTAPAPHAGEQHKFWDRSNYALFTAVTALSAADFVVTRDNLQSGGRELNPVTRVFGKSTAGLAVNFAGESAAVVAISYFFHKTGHHKLERMISMVNAGSSAAAVSFDLAHR